MKSYQMVITRTNFTEIIKTESKIMTLTNKCMTKLKMKINKKISMTS